MTGKIGAVNAHAKTMGSGEVQKIQNNAISQETWHAHQEREEEENEKCIGKTSVINLV